MKRRDPNSESDFGVLTTRSGAALRIALSSSVRIRAGRSLTIVGGTSLSRHSHATGAKRSSRHGLHAHARTACLRSGADSARNSDISSSPARTRLERLSESVPLKVLRYVAGQVALVAFKLGLRHRLRSRCAWSVLDLDDFVLSGSTVAIVDSRKIQVALPQTRMVFD
jgi:hypothetical protein